MALTQSETLTSNQKQQILKIWNSEYPTIIGFKSIEGLEEYLNKLAQPTHYIVFDDANSVIGWLCAFDRDGSRWFVVLVSSASQGKGIGTQLVKAMQLDETEVSGWIAAKNDYLRGDGSFYKPPLSFYEKLGFQLTTVEYDNGIIASRKIMWIKSK